MDDTEGTHTSPPIIRAAELQEIVIALSGPEPAGIIVSGPGGSGMTTLLDAAASVLSGSFSVIAHNVSESFADIPFGIAMALVPDLPARTKVWPGSIVAACRKAVRGAAASGSPALLVLDNIDFLDDMSLWLLNQLLVEPDIRLIATHRSDRPLRMELMESVVSRQLSVVTLDDLTEEQLREFLDDRLGGRSARSLVREIHILTGGNLQTAKLLLDEAAARGEIVEQAGSWMLSGPIRMDGSQALELTRHRLEGYSVPQRQVVDLLAVGEPIPLAVLEQLVQKRAIEALRADGTIRVQKDNQEAATLSHAIEGRLARQQLGPARILELHRSIYAASSPAGDDSLWTLFRRVDLEQASGLTVPDADLLAVAVAANDVHDHRRARRSAEAVRTPELGLAAGVELARALYQTRDFPGAVTILKGLVANTPDVLSLDFAHAVWLLLQALLPTAPGASGLQAVLQDARRRLEDAAVGIAPGEAAYSGYAAVRDELDVLQLYLDAQNGSWPSASGELFQRLCHSQLVDPGSPSERHPMPPTQAGVLLMALVSQGLAVSGRFADAVALSTLALEALGRLPRCPVDFHSAVLTIHGSNLIWRGQWGGPEMFCAGSSSYSNRMSYFGGSAHLYRALVLARQGSLELACEQFRQAKARLDEADPDGLLPPALGGLAAAAWLLGDVNQVRRALAAYDSRASSGNYLASQLAESYSSAARSVLLGTEHSHRKLLQLAGSAAKKGHRALEMLNLGLAARTGSRGYRQLGAGVSELVWSVESGMPSGEEAGQEMGTGQLSTSEPQQAFDQEEAFAFDEPRPVGPEPASSALPGVVKLSQREREVTALVASGLSSAEVAARLGIAVNTVNAHLQRVYGKLGVSRRQKLSELWDELAKPEEE
ncbi:helix-turn-helix transcriptional regulator [Arthrobacter bambusae]|uniref:helix-turn-helix transcriptional regulator n=1 Tax=Arthrobacter bambusae TaxID=1338426 RepID=UPI002781628B|nr:LuxR C-terminal-related transcriptional regulator [Arthrobacter bambusae]MDQ0029219.1 DNA-binding CsgD family transcriptional regulator [Arthrobacter bambusae]MDQ0098128.1 DNA-binding CsgD family transcriptional regulator [Arthrobacter bambusae]